MIAKHVPMRALGKSDFAGLVAYVTDAQDKTERLGAVTVTNCEAATLDAATRDAVPLNAVIAEVLATQRQNTRAAGDKTFHLLVSFRAGESPGAATLKAIEARLCAGLGYGEHQRVSAVHHDTDNLHLHVAINKIHPKRHTLHEPFQSYRTLAALCATLEREYGLKADNHQPRRSVAEGRAADMEHHAGVESLVGWVRRTCLEDLRAAPSWGELHQILHENGLALHARGNGLVVEALDGTRVKASTVARALSRPALEARLGPFEAPPAGPAPAAIRRHYERAPLRLRVDTAELYARYRAEQQRRAGERADALACARRRKMRAMEDARRANRLWRATISVVDGRGIGKKRLYAQAARALRERLAGIHAAYAKERQALYQGFRRQAWADWLKAAALEGRAEALAALRAREAAQGLAGNTLAGRGALRCGPLPVQDTITKKGTILFRAGPSAVRDDGDRLQVSREVTPEGVQAALRLAIARYGNEITVSGTPEFKAQVIRAAVEGALHLTFADPVLECRRQRRSSKENTHERAHEHAHKRAMRAERGSPDRRRPGGAGAGLAAADPLIQFGARTGAGWNGTDGRSDGRQPDPGRIGRLPPPASRHRLRELSELGVVRFADGAEVLLPRDVPRDLEQRGAQPDHPLRRGVAGGGGLKSKPPGSGPLTPAQLAAAHAYIAEREEKRRIGIDIPKHTLYDDCAGVMTFAGLRHLDGEALALVRRGEADAADAADVVMVLAVDAATARRLSRLALGDAVTVTPHGSIRTSRGSSR